MTDEDRVERLCDWTARAGAEQRFTFRRGRGDEDTLTGPQLHANAVAIGRALAARRAAGSRVVLALPHALELLAALVGCSHADVAAVPTLVDVADPPEQFVAKVLPLVAASEATLVVTDAAHRGALRDVTGLPDDAVVDVRELLAERREGGPRDATPTDPAILLFTSGSTSAPKGVVLAHGDIAGQVALTRRLWGTDGSTVAVSWLPLAHNFGLPLAFLVPLVAGGSGVVLPPSLFVRDPVEWLRALSDHRATHTGAPNFAFELVTRLVEDAELDALDLGSLRRALSAGEPVRGATVRRFRDRMSRAGLRRSAAAANYGMTEIGAVFTTALSRPPRVLSVDVSELAAGRVRRATGRGTTTVTAVGPAHDGVDLRIVDPQTRQERPEGAVGELWLDFPGLFSGYFRRPDADADAFATPVGSQTVYLRTGDLGFIHDGHVYIAGREKELIIVHGENRYPVDIERVVQNALPDAPGSVAFGVEHDGAERVVVLIESPDVPAERLAELAGAVVSAVSEHLGLRCHDVVFVDEGGIPRSPLGKVLRRVSRTAYLDGDLRVRHALRTAVTGPPGPERSAAPAPAADRAAALERLVSTLAGVLGVSADRIDVSRSFGELGMDSLQYVCAARGIEEAFGARVSPAQLFTHGSIVDLLDDLLGGSAPDGDDAGRAAGGVADELAGPPSGGRARRPRTAEAERDDVAIIGMVCELPGGATDPETFWRHLDDGVDAVTEITRERSWLGEEYARHWGGDPADLPRFAALTGAPGAFDADFFSISPHEAQCMDPQQRKALEATWRLLEDAGHAPSALRGRDVGVFVGAHSVDYADLVLRQPGALATYGAHVDSGLHPSLLANRVSRWFGFHGPSETLNTACSSSLVALSRAVASLRAGDSSVAVVLGVNMLLGARGFVATQAAGMLSPSGRCHTLDADADGFVRGEGIVAIAIKPLARALADGDHVAAVIRAAVVNHDGRTDSLRAPSVTAQRDLLLTAYGQAGVDVGTVGYVELHGTGTALGDPIEVSALVQAFTTLAPDLPRGGCGLGSVKTNIGHLEAAAGLAGLLKVVLAMRHRTLPGLLHLTRLNPHIDLEGSPFRAVTGTEAWQPALDVDGSPLPRRAGVSSFGFGGANAHVVLEEAPAADPVGGGPGPVPIVLSARTRDRLDARVDDLLAHLAEHPVELADLAWTLASGREHLAHRLAFVAASIEELREHLEAFRAGRPQPGVWSGDARATGASVAVFADEELRATLAGRATAGRFDLALRVWAAGADLAGPVLLGPVTGRRIRLPGYRFAPTTHWLPEASAPGPQPTAAVAARPPTGDDLHLLEEVWEYTPPAAGTADVGRLVCVAQGQPLRTVVRTRAAARGWQAAFLVPVDEGACADDERAVDLDDPAAVAAVLAELGGTGAGIGALVDLRALARPEAIDDLLAPLRLVAGLVRSGVRPRLLALAAVAGDDHRLALAESWLGIERTFGVLVPGTTATVTLVDRRANGMDPLDIVLDEIGRPTPRSTLHDGGGRSERQVRRLAHPAPPAADVVRRGGTYLVTGGLGGLGLVVARHLAEAGAGALVLTGRRGPSVGARSVIDELERSGVRVIVKRADVADETAMLAARDEARAVVGPLHGIVHAAGVDPSGELSTSSTEAILAVLRPKIDGTLVLGRLTAQEDDLDFCCLFSSAAAVLGDFGAASYAMGSAFQAAWAARRPGRRTLAVQWPLWASGGMRLTSSAAAMYERGGQRALRTQEGLALLDALLVAGVAAPLVLAGDRVAEQLAPEPAPRVAAAPPQAPARVATYAAATEEVLRRRARDVVAALVAATLHSDADLDPAVPLVELGADSVLLTTLATRFGMLVGDRLTPALFFEHATIDALARHLFEAYPAAVRAATADAAQDERSPAAVGTTMPTLEVPRRPAARDCATEQAIAVVGMSGRFPESRDVDELWASLLAGRDLVQEAPDERARRDVAGCRGGYLPGVDEFDPLSFGIAPKDAVAMDPRQRLLLQEAWRAMENAGIGPQQRRERTIATYVGAEDGCYHRLLDEPGTVTANHTAVLASRLAYVLDLDGPAMVVNTACSSGLVAVHQARLALLRGECDTALVAGVNVLVSREYLRPLADAGMLSPGGACRPFDRRADGIVPGEAVAVLVLRRQADAVRDGDRILGLLSGSGINQDGRTNGITAPSRAAQSALMRRVIAEAGVEPARIGCVVSHGTGTALGDPIEVEALVEAFGDVRPDSCALVSTKGAHGHTFAAAGVVNVVTLLLALRSGRIPGTVGFGQPSGYVNWPATPFRVSAAPSDWSGREGVPRLGAASAFGVSGTNALVLAEEPPAARPRTPRPGPHLLVLSARTAAALRRRSLELADALERDGADLDVVGHTLLERRDHWRLRRALVVTDVAHAVEVLRASPGGAPFDVTGTAPRGALPEDAVAEVAALLAGARADRLTVAVLERLAHAYCEGHDVCGDHLSGGRPLPVADVPGYPFERDSHWPAAHRGPAARGEQGSLVLTVPATEPFVLPSGVGAGERLVVLAQPDRAAVDAVAATGAEVLAVPWDRLDVPGLYSDACVGLMGTLRTELHRPGGPPLTVQVVVPATGRADVLAGLHGLVLSVHRECPRIRPQLVTVEPSIPAATLAGRLVEAAAASVGRLTLTTGGWTRTVWRPAPTRTPSHYRDGGVYLLTGAGAITEHLAPHVAGRARDATVILCGRSAPGAVHDETVRAVQAAGGTGEYRRADVTDRGAVRALVEAVLREHGRLDGIVHAAGVVSDGYLLRKDVEQARDVLAPKVRGAVLLDEATRELDLELFVLCSSLSATSGNAGQADYAAGNGFLDAFARERAARVRAGTRRGVSVSIGWPLWHDGGMRTETAALAAMRDSTGLVPLPTVEALRAFDLALACGEPHTVVLYGDRERAMAALAEEPGAGVAATRTADLPDLAGPSGLADAVLERLAVVFARMSGVAAAELDPDEEMGSYGLDSFMVTNINHALGQVFPRAPKTLFFEHPTLRGVAGALAADFATESRHWIDDHRPYTTELPTVAVHRAPDGVVRRAPTVPRTAAGSEPARPPIAVIGMSGRFPDADDLEAFWANLRAGRDSVTEVPADRWPLEGFYEPDPDLAVHEHKSYGKWGGFLSGHAEFDPLFFGISPREATEMDPQERLFLQECWRAVEDAGYSRRRLGASLGGRVGVFVGVTRSGYGLLGSRGSRVTPRTNFGSIANRVSFVLDLSGPSMPIDTMCSSSLTAVHEACEHIRRGECDAALVGGVNVYTHPDAFVEMSQRRMLSPTGRCRSFGESGDGLVPGEGVAAVLLRPLDRALADGDRVLAVLAGSAVNHGGRTSGYSVPNPVAQSRLVSAALFRAGVSAAEVSYVEAHGTGTALGDPIELSGLNVPFRRHGSTEGACALGSVKSNIGHLEAAAGIAGLVKIVLQLRHRELVPTLHASRPNPQLDLEGSPFRLQRELSAWKADVGPLTAGLSSFGAGGANAHVVVRALDDDNPAAALREEDR